MKTWLALSLGIGLFWGGIIYALGAHLAGVIVGLLGFLLAWFLVRPLCCVAGTDWSKRHDLQE
jgi:uncharacterized membrane protein